MDLKVYRDFRLKKWERVLPEESAFKKLMSRQGRKYMKAEKRTESGEIALKGWVVCCPHCGKEFGYPLWNSSGLKEKVRSWFLGQMCLDNAVRSDTIRLGRDSLRSRLRCPRCFYEGQIAKEARDFVLETEPGESISLRCSLSLSEFLTLPWMSCKKLNYDPTGSYAEYLYLDLKKGECYLEARADALRISRWDLTFALPFESKDDPLMETLSISNCLKRKLLQQFRPYFGRSLPKGTETASIFDLALWNRFRGFEDDFYAALPFELKSRRLWGDMESQAPLMRSRFLFESFLADYAEGESEQFIEKLRKWPAFFFYREEASLLEHIPGLVPDFVWKDRASRDKYLVFLASLKVYPGTRQLLELLSENKAASHEASVGLLSDFWEGAIEYAAMSPHLKEQVRKVLDKGVFFPLLLERLDYVYSIERGCSNVLLDTNFCYRSLEKLPAETLTSWMSTAGVPNTPAIRQLLYKNPSLFLYAEEIGVYAQFMDDLNHLQKFLSYDDVLGKLEIMYKERPALEELLRDYRRVKRSSAAVFALVKSMSAKRLGYNAMMYHSAADCVKKEEQKKWCVKHWLKTVLNDCELDRYEPNDEDALERQACSGTVFAARRHFPYDVLNPKSRVKDLPVSVPMSRSVNVKAARSRGYLVIPLENSQDYFRTGSELGNCLRDWEYNGRKEGTVLRLVPIGKQRSAAAAELDFFLDKVQLRGPRNGSPDEDVEQAFDGFMLQIERQNLPEKSFMSISRPDGEMFFEDDAEDYHEALRELPFRNVGVIRRNRPYPRHRLNRFLLQNLR